MQARFLLGPAGSGKTHRCLVEIREALAADPDGPPLVLLAPKQATFQLERQLLAEPTLVGYTRLRILSFERLAEFVLATLRVPAPDQLAEEGRLMVLRALVAEHAGRLELFRASAHLPGFARQLNLSLRELQHHQWPPERLTELAGKIGASPQLPAKLRDLSFLLRAYLDWLKANQLQDSDCLLNFAAETLRCQGGDFHVRGLWLDGFAEMTPQELHLLAAVTIRCEQATLAFCLESEPHDEPPWLSAWSVVSQTFRECYARLASLDGTVISVETLARDSGPSRFAAAPPLAHLEAHWTSPLPHSGIDVLAERRHRPGEMPAARCRDAAAPGSRAVNQEALRIVACREPETEAVLAAHEILRYVRDAGGRFRDCAVLLRSLDGYHDVFRRTFTRYDIPFFLDRREGVSHHPLAELTRFSLRLAAFGWQRDDLFGALKTGLVGLAEAAADRLENAALEFGWDGDAWCRPLRAVTKPEVLEWAEPLRLELAPPFVALADQVKGEIHGGTLAAALRELWATLRVQQTLERWSQEARLHRAPASPDVHGAVWEQLQLLLENLELAFPSRSMTVDVWLPILEAGLANLSVGVIPPALDQVLIGAVDRSRNPELQLAILPGFNETVFPASTREAGLFTETERDALAEYGARLGPGRLRRLGHERYYGYIACARARRRLVVSYSRRDAEDRELQPSPFVAQLQRLFPALAVENVEGSTMGASPRAQPPSGTTGELAIKDACATFAWVNFEHASELVAPLFKNELAPTTARSAALGSLLESPALEPIRGVVSRLPRYPEVERLSVAVAEQLHLAIESGRRVFSSSVTRLETFAACPFRFFVETGLRAEERKRFKVDQRERGTLQHEVLERFHREVVHQSRRWRDLSPDEAADLIGRLMDESAAVYREGLFVDDEENRFTMQALKASLQRFVRVVIGWMRTYQFDPTLVELSFGLGDPSLPSWRIPLSDGRELALRGKVDRVDIGPTSGAGAWCAVLDYKSGAHKLDKLLLHHGLQLQLPAYLAAVVSLAREGQLAGFTCLRPAGMFYANLGGATTNGASRDEVLGLTEAERASAYRHYGRFNWNAVGALDAEARHSTSGPFNFKFKKDGSFSHQQPDPMTDGEFSELLAHTEAKLREFATRILNGEAAVDPYRRGGETACQRCDFQAVCRIDPRAHRFRTLTAAPKA